MKTLITIFLVASFMLVACGSANATVTGDDGAAKDHHDSTDSTDSGQSSNKRYPPNATLAKLPDRSWSQIPGTKMTSVASTLLYDGVSTCCGFAIYAYSGAVKDAKNGRILFWGGGHNDYYGNEVYLFDLKTLRWERLTDPSPKSPTECATANKVHIFSDGEPKSRHTYDQMVYISDQDKLWAHGGSICGPVGYGIVDSWTFDPETRTWTDLNPTLTYTWNNNLGHSAEYDPKTKLIYYFNSSSIQTFNTVTNNWTTLQAAFSHPIDRSSLLHPRVRKIVTYGGYLNSNQVSVFDIDKQLVDYPSVPSDLPARRAPGWAFDSRNELFMAYGGFGYDKRDVWYYNVETNDWFSELIPGGPDGNQFHYERFVYDDVNDVTYFFRSPYEDVWVLKNLNPQPSPDS